MKFVTYAATPELTRFPQSERFRVYRSTHKRLMREDAEYRQRVRRFRWGLIWPPLVFTSAWLILCFVALPDSYGHGSAPAWCIAAIVLLVLAQLLVTLRDLAGSFRMQEFQNERVGRALQDEALNSTCRP